MGNLFDYFEIEGVGKLREIDVTKKEKVQKTLFQRFQGTVFIDTIAASKELMRQKKYKTLAKELIAPVSSPSQARRVFRDLAKYYNIKSGLERVIFWYREGGDLYFFFFSGNKLIELDIDSDSRMPAAIGKVYNVRFSEAGKKEGFSAMLGTGGASTMASVVKSLLFHKSLNGSPSYSFMGAKSSQEEDEESSRRSRLYILLIKTFSKQLKAFLYVYREFENKQSKARYVLSFKKLREFEKSKGISLKNYAVDSQDQESQNKSIQKVAV